jgi:hypothetical protein
MVFNATFQKYFNYIVAQFYCRRKLWYPEKTIGLLQVTTEGMLLLMFTLILNVQVIKKFLLKMG